MNELELESVISAMSITGIRNLKDWTKFSTLKMADIVHQQAMERQQQSKLDVGERDEQEVRSDATADTKVLDTASDSGEQGSPTV